MLPKLFTLHDSNDDGTERRKVGNVRRSRVYKYRYTIQFVLANRHTEFEPAPWAIDFVRMPYETKWTRLIDWAVFSTKGGRIVFDISADTVIQSCSPTNLIIKNNLISRVFKSQLRPTHCIKN